MDAGWATDRQLTGREVNGSNRACYSFRLAAAVGTGSKGKGQEKKEAWGWGYLDLVLGEESEALEEDGGKAREKEDGLVEQEGDDGGELELGEVGDQELHSFPLRFARRGRAERDRDLGMRRLRRERRESRYGRTEID